MAIVRRGGGFTVSAATYPLGGQIQYTGSRLLGLLGITVGMSGQVSINGNEVFNVNALLSLPTGTESGASDVSGGDVITGSGLSSIYFVPYVAN